ncbi:hypothetical protein KIN20_036921 [Parelaphostrongylus tenuis]|uniref:Uncharacterized protein n=1 Tax=Parelaphostrongylus tenuis TaxID=148309 RepID=A0AAD5RDW8_PARTN|nr:hypothetical protein KIN20_036921 [Parelaphostrongylus tenuis]
MRCTKATVALILLLCLFFVVSPVFPCGTMPFGQERRVAFNVSGFTLPVRMVWTSNPTTAAKNAEILRSEMEVQSLVHRLIMHAVTDVLEEQGRRAGLLPAVVSAILNQLSIQARYSPLQCEEVVSSEVIPGPKGTCFISGNTVASICDMPPAGPRGAAATAGHSRRSPCVWK